MNLKFYFKFEKNIINFILLEFINNKKQIKNFIIVFYLLKSFINNKKLIKIVENDV